MSREEKEGDLTGAYYGQVVQESEFWKLVDFGVTAASVWIPKSEIFFEGPAADDLRVFVIPLWLAEKEGLE